MNDCEVVSTRDCLRFWTEKDYIEDSYMFEVSSPGLGRPLKKEKDLYSSMGKEVRDQYLSFHDRQKEGISPGS